MRVMRCIDREGSIRLGTPVEMDTAEELRFTEAGDYERTGRMFAIKTYLPPVAPPAVFCIGLNYRDHAGETGMPLPEYPIVFMKNPASVIGHREAIVLPSSCREPLQADYEVELAVIIGRPAKNVSRNEALSYVKGYTVANDVSARIWQKKAGGGQWVRGKSFDTFCPLGPFLVTADELGDPGDLALSLTLNGTLMQQSRTSRMIFSVAELIAYLSEDTTLMPDTVILTGTPEGVGFAQKPPVYLKPQDRLELKVERIGSLENHVV